MPDYIKQQLLSVSRPSQLRRMVGPGAWQPPMQQNLCELQTFAFFTIIHDNLHHTPLDAFTTTPIGLHPAHGHDYPTSPLRPCTG